MATATAMSAERSLANKRRRHETDARVVESMKLALTNERRCLEMATARAMSAEHSLANERCHHETAAWVAELVKGA